MYICRSVIMALTKPQMRNLLGSRVKRDFLIAATLSVLAGAGYYFGVKILRISIYEDFYKYVYFYFF